MVVYDYVPLLLQKNTATSTTNCCCYSVSDVARNTVAFLWTIDWLANNNNNTRSCARNKSRKGERSKWCACFSVICKQNSYKNQNDGVSYLHILSFTSTTWMAGCLVGWLDDWLVDLTWVELNKFLMATLLLSKRFFV